MDKPLNTTCMHYREGKCYFVVSNPTKCKLCFNFVTTDPEIKKKYGITDPVVTLYDIIKEDKVMRAMFPESGDAVQTTFEF